MFASFSTCRSVSGIKHGGRYWIMTQIFSFTRQSRHYWNKNIETFIICHCISITKFQHKITISTVFRRGGWVGTSVPAAPVWSEGKYTAGPDKATTTQVQSGIILRWRHPDSWFYWQVYSWTVCDRKHVLRSVRHPWRMARIHWLCTMQIYQSV